MDKAEHKRQLREIDDALVAAFKDAIKARNQMILASEIKNVDGLAELDDAKVLECGARLGLLRQRVRELQRERRTIAAEL